MNRKNSQLNKFLKKSDSNSIMTDKFQEKLYSWFEDKGLLSELRAHLRQKMINTLKGTYVGVQSLNEKNSKSVSPKLQAINLLIADFLISLQYHYTLSVFVTEVPLLSNLSEFSTYVSKIADKDFDNSAGIETPRIHKKDVEDILQALGFPPNAHINIRTRRMYQFNRENKALLTCLIECLQAANFDSTLKQRGQEKINNNADDELWPKEIRDVFIDSDLSFEQLEILQEHITRYYKNAVKKLRAEEESKYRLKVSEVLQKEKETYGKLAETEKRLIEQQEIIEKEITQREEQLKSLSTALRKQHDAIAERLSQLQEQSLKLSEKEKALKAEKKKEAEQLKAKKSELELKEKELEEAYARLAEEQKKIGDEKKMLELTQKLIGGTNVHDCNEPQNNVKFLQHLSQQCSALSQKLAAVRNEHEEASVKNLSSVSQNPSVSESAALFKQHKELINETKATLEQKINELMMRLEETKEKHLVNESQVPETSESTIRQTKNLTSIAEEPDGFNCLDKLDSDQKNKQHHEKNLLSIQSVDAAESILKNENQEQHEYLNDEGQPSSQTVQDGNDNKIIEVETSRTSLIHQLNVERHLVKKLQEENAEFKAHTLLQNQRIIDLTIQTRDLESRVNSTNTVQILPVSSTDVSVPCTTVSVISSYSPIVAPAAPFALARPRRQWFNRHVGSGEESTFSPLNAAPSTSGRPRVRELRKKFSRRIVTPNIPCHSSSTETSSGMDTLEETRNRLQKLEKESAVVNRMYQDYQSRKEQNSQVIFQQIETGSTNTQPIYNYAESQKGHSSLVTSGFQPYKSFRPICSTLRPIITSVLPQSSFFSQNVTASNLSDSRGRFSKNTCGVVKKLSNKNVLDCNVDECECFGEPNSIYQKCHPNRKFRHYYRHWLDSHFRKSGFASPTDSGSRISPFKQLFHLKQYKYKKSQAATLKCRSTNEHDDEERKSLKSLRVFDLANDHLDEKSPQLTGLENEEKIQQSYAHPVTVKESESFVSSSDLDDSLKFERVILQNQQNVAALRKKFENIHDFNNKIKSAESTVYFLENRFENNLQSPKITPNENATVIKSKINVNADCSKTEETCIDSSPKMYKITPLLDMNSNDVLAKSKNQNAENFVCDFSQNGSILSRNNIEKEEPPKNADQIILTEKSSDSKSNAMEFDSIAASKIKENYKRLSLYNRLNDYYEEIINEMNASEEEKQNLSEIDQLLHPAVNDSEELSKSVEDSKENCLQDLIKKPTGVIAKFESPPKSSDSSCQTPFNI